MRGVLLSLAAPRGLSCGSACRTSAQLQSRSLQPQPGSVARDVRTELPTPTAHIVGRDVQSTALHVNL
eukprot:2586870-Rhodomonas_salina.2